MRAPPLLESICAKLQTPVIFFARLDITGLFPFLTFFGIRIANYGLHLLMTVISFFSRSFALAFICGVVLQRAFIQSNGTPTKRINCYGLYILDATARTPALPRPHRRKRSVTLKFILFFHLFLHHHQPKFIRPSPCLSSGAHHFARQPPGCCSARCRVIALWRFLLVDRRQKLHC